MNNIPLTATAKAHTNIALVKYWGKKEPQLIIPNTGSLSVTLNDFYTTSTVTFANDLKEDQVTIDDYQLTSEEKTRVVSFLDIVRNMSGCQLKARVTSNNHVPTAAGLASSASAFAALATASTHALGLDLSTTELSILARKGSGSACRSIYGGFVEWLAGDSDQTSYATPVTSNLSDLNLVVLNVNKNKKKIGSRHAMAESVATSPFYKEWPNVVNQDLKTVKQALLDDDFTTLGMTSELNAMRMHALTLSADPSFLYFNGTTLKIIEEVHHLRQSGIECYCTIDAGPNVKVLCQNQHLDAVIAHFTPLLGATNVTPTKMGPAVTLL